MTKALAKAEKRHKKEVRKQQKAASKTAKTVSQPKPEEKTAGQEAEPVNLCDDCAYEYGECEGKPKFASDQDKTLTGPAADRVVECEGFLNVAEMPTAQEAGAESGSLAAAAEAAGAEVTKTTMTVIPEIVIVCSGGCGKTTEGMTFETRSGEFKQVDESGVPEWTCQECLDKRGESAADQESEEPAPAPETQVIRKDLPERPDPKRFLAEEDFGACQSCEMPLKRTALNRYQDAIRCTNGRCRVYRVVVKTISTGVR